MYKGFHRKPNIQKIHTSQKEGEWGLMCVKTTILNEALDPEHPEIHQDVTQR